MSQIKVEAPEPSIVKAENYSPPIELETDKNEKVPDWIDTPRPVFAWGQPGGHNSAQSLATKEQAERDAEK